MPKAPCGASRRRLRRLVEAPCGAHTGPTRFRPCERCASGQCRLGMRVISSVRRRSAPHCPCQLVLPLRSMTLPTRYESHLRHAWTYGDLVVLPLYPCSALCVAMTSALRSFAQCPVCGNAEASWDACPCHRTARRGLTVSRVRRPLYISYIIAPRARPSCHLFPF